MAQTLRVARCQILVKAPKAAATTTGRTCPGPTTPRAATGPGKAPQGRWKPHSAAGAIPGRWAARAPARLVAELAGQGIRQRVGYRGRWLRIGLGRLGAGPWLHRVDRAAALDRAGRIWRFRQMLSAYATNKLVVNRAPPGNLTACPAAPFLILQEHQHGAALVGIASAQAMGRVGPGAVQDGIAQAALAHLARQLAQAGVQACGKPVEALGQPEAIAFLKHHRGGKTAPAATAPVMRQPAAHPASDHVQ